MYIFNPPINIKFIICSFRRFGEPKLKKPKELKGVKMDRSIKGFERRIQIFRKEDDIWLKDLGYEIYRVTKKDSKTNKTLSTYCMNTQAWLKIEGLFPVLNNPLYSIIDIIQHIVRQERIIKENFHKDEYIGEYYCVAERKWEKIIKNIIDIYNIKR